VSGIDDRALALTFRTHIREEIFVALSGALPILGDDS
jgi:hypothetical protein